MVTSTGTLRTFRNVESGVRIYSMRGDRERLVERAARVTGQAVRMLPGLSDVAGALVVYCGGCKMAIGEDIHNVSSAVADELGDAPFIGVLHARRAGPIAGSQCPRQLDDLRRRILEVTAEIAVAPSKSLDTVEELREALITLRTEHEALLLAEHAVNPSNLECIAAEPAALPGSRLPVGPFFDKVMNGRVVATVSHETVAEWCGAAEFGLNARHSGLYVPVASGCHIPSSR